MARTLLVQRWSFHTARVRAANRQEFPPWDVQGVDLVDTLAFRLGVSGPALIQEVLRLIDEPSVIVANPRPCRILRERREAGRALRSRFRLTARSEV